MLKEGKKHIDQFILLVFDCLVFIQERDEEGGKGLTDVMILERKEGN